MTMFKIFLFLFIIMNFELIELNAEAWTSPLDGFFSSEGSHLQGTVDIPASEVVSSAQAVGNNIKGRNHIVSNVVEKYGRAQSPCSPFFHRFVNILLKVIDVKPNELDDDIKKKIAIDLHVSQKTLRILQSFGSGDAVPCDELDESFVSLFDSNIDDGFFPDVGEYMLGWFSFNFYGPSTVMFLLTILMILIFTIPVVRGFYRISLVGLIMFIYYALSVGLDLFSQYEDLYARQIVALEETLSAGGRENIPDACFPSKMSLMDKLFHYFSSDCEKYLQTKKSIWSQMDIERAFTKPVLSLLFSFVPEFGNKAGEATKKFSDHFMFPLNFILPCLTLVYFFPSLISGVFGYLFHSNLVSKEAIKDKSDSEPRSQPALQSTSLGNVTYNIFPPVHQALLGPPSVPASSSKPLREMQKKRNARKRALLNSKTQKKAIL